MNGPEHYREAERLMNSTDAVIAEIARKNGSTADAAFAAGHVMEAAQVHATLAAAAAAAIPAVQGWLGTEGARDLAREWAEVAG